MHILVLGGTVFLGRHIVSQALAAGHKVTTLNRGTHVLPEQSDVEKLVDDREKDLDVLVGRKFDAVIDTCGYRPEVVAHSIQALKGSVETYVFISTISAYGKFLKKGINESDPITYTAAGEAGDYGTLKADCEKVVFDLIPNEALVIRPGLIVGPYDPTDRFTYWPARVARGGDVLAPGDPNRAIQFTDVRDLSIWIMNLTQAKARGVYNAKGTKARLSMSEFLETCKTTTGSDCRFVWMNDKVLEEAGVQPFVEMPLWIPASANDYAGFMDIDCSKALESGLSTRPLSETIEDTLTWERTLDPAAPRKAGLTHAREKQLLTDFDKTLHA